MAAAPPHDGGTRLDANEEFWGLRVVNCRTTVYTAASWRAVASRLLESLFHRRPVIVGSHATCTPLEERALGPPLQATEKLRLVPNVDEPSDASRVQTSVTMMVVAEHHLGGRRRMCGLVAAALCS